MLAQEDVPYIQYIHRIPKTCIAYFTKLLLPSHSFTIFEDIHDCHALSQLLPFPFARARRLRNSLTDRPPSSSTSDAHVHWHRRIRIADLRNCLPYLAAHKAVANPRPSTVEMSVVWRETEETGAAETLCEIDTGLDPHAVVCTGSAHSILRAATSVSKLGGRKGEKRRGGEGTHKKCPGAHHLLS